MNPPRQRGGDETADLLVDIVTLLESRGMPSDSYQLHQAIDVEALALLAASSAEGIEIRFTVEGVELVVTKDGVDFARDDPGDAREL